MTAALQEFVKNDSGFEQYADRYEEVSGDLYVRRLFAAWTAEMDKLDIVRALGLAEGKAEGLAEGLAEGKAEGLAEGKAEGLAEGKAEGLAEGKAEGLAEGKAEGLAEGKAEGLAEGKAEGEKEKAIKAAQNLLSLGVTPEIVAKGVELSKEEVLKLIQ